MTELWGSGGHACGAGQRSLFAAVGKGAESKQGTLTLGSLGQRKTPDPDFEPADNKTKKAKKNESPEPSDAQGNARRGKRTRNDAPLVYSDDASEVRV